MYGFIFILKLVVSVDRSAPPAPLHHAVGSAQTSDRRNYRDNTVGDGEEIAPWRASLQGTGGTLKHVAHR